MVPWLSLERISSDVAVASAHETSDSAQGAGKMNDLACFVFPIKKEHLRIAFHSEKAWYKEWLTIETPQRG